MQIDKTEIQNRVKVIANERGESLKDVCRACGLGVNALYQGNNLTAKTLCAIAEHLECSVDYLLGRVAHLNGEECELLIDRTNSDMPLRMLLEIYGAELVTHYNDYKNVADLIREEEKGIFY